MPDKLGLRALWNGTPTKMFEAWHLSKALEGRRARVHCEVWTHQRGWEVRLVMEGKTQAFMTSPSSTAVEQTLESMESSLREHGWS